MGSNFYIGNNQNASGLYEPLRQYRGDPRFERDDARLLAEQAERRQLTPREVSNYWLNQAISEIQAEPSRWFRLLAWKAFLTLHATEIVDAESERVHARDSLLLRLMLPLLHFGILLPLAVLGIWLTRQDFVRWGTLYAIIIVFSLSVVVFYVMGRYRYPLVPVLTLFAAAGLLEATHRLWSKTGLGDLAIGVSCAVGVAILSNWPQPKLIFDQVTYINIANALQDMHRPQDSIAPLKEALKIQPRYADAYNNLGNAYLAMGQSEDAIASLSQAIKLNPRMTFAYLNLARAFESRGETQQAVESSRQAISLDPLFAEAHQLLGRILCSQGYFSEGIPHLEQAVNLDPKSPEMKGELANGYARQGNYREGIQVLREAYREHPKSIEVGNNLAAFLATAPDDRARNGKEAVAIATEIVRRTEGKHPIPLDTLAAAYAEVGDTAQAVKTLLQAMEVARSLGNKDLVRKMSSTLEEYKAGKPHRDDSWKVTPQSLKEGRRPLPDDD
jgi:tetratricopeptide (TPR) repeat protein